MKGVLWNGKNEQHNKAGIQKGDDIRDAGLTAPDDVTV